MNNIYRITTALVRRFNAARAEVAALTVDEILPTISGFASLDALVQESLRTGYTPSLYAVPSNYRAREMRRAALAERVADAYDAAMASAGSMSRAYRGSELVIPVTA